ncbi:hypothetical protein K7I13_13915 [Brucepastera parasyntrophica]|uniref:hypothetical protein n=1 Tax=Brucepastera parasyntrophica TaxID=2880008 RepID=UPI00210C62D5|nr:hypothetical protein [Brucepastera parasyntrophica]ULQ59544.1 hypothetical protein K7I13_13915 [Brucepastera parasyntrophica]
MAESKNAWIHDDPSKDCAEANPVNSFWIDKVYDSETETSAPLNKLACRAGGRVWNYFCGTENAPADREPADMFCRLAELAAAAENADMQAELFYIVSYVLYDIGEKKRPLLETLKSFLLRDSTYGAFSGSGLAYRMGGPEDFASILEDTGDGSGIFQEWFGPYYAWLEEVRKSRAKADAALENYTAEIKTILAPLSRGELDEAFAQYRRLMDTEQEIFTGSLPVIFLQLVPYNTFSPEVREKLLTYNIRENTDTVIREYLSEYREWDVRKDDPEFLADKSRRWLNSTAPYYADFYISQGLILAPEHNRLRLYRAYSIIFYSVRESEGSLSGKVRNDIREQLPVLEKLLGVFPGQEAFVRYTLGSGLYLLGEIDAARREINRAAELDPTLRPARDELFSDIPSDGCPDNKA